MFMTAFIAIVCVGFIGLGILVAHRHLYPSDDTFRISGSEFAAAIAVVSLIVTPLVLVIGEKLSINSLLSYQEFYNGVELEPEVQSVKCRAGKSGSSASSGKSNCDYSYDSGKDYTYTEFYTVQECSGSGENRSCRTVTKTRTRWASIYYPYATIEYHYSIPDTLGGNHRFPQTYLASDPEPFASKGIPSKYPRGAPADWLNAKEQFEAGDPRPVTRMFDYDNFILAAKEDLLKANDANVKKYQKAKLLPDHTANILKDPIYGPSKRQAKKLSLVGVSLKNEDIWQDALMRFNAACGMKLQCDLHVVLIDSSKVPRADAGQYVQALKAYWQSDRFGKRAISKNAIILAVGTQDDQTIEWANATTGMPYGNNVMLESLASQLANKPLDPMVIFGAPRTVATPYKDKEGDIDYRVVVTHTDEPGVLETVVFNASYGFERPCMESCDDGEIGYADLVDKIEPTKGQKAWMIFIICFFSIFFWWLVATTSIADTSSYLSYKPTRNRFDRYKKESSK